MATKISKRQQRLSQKKNEQGLNPAQVVIQTYPSFTEIFQYAIDNIVGVKGSMTHRFYTTLPEEYRWEAVSDLVDTMVEQAFGRPFHTFYAVKVNKNTGFMSDKDSFANVYDHQKQEYEISGDEFLACLKIMAIHWMNYKNYNDKMFDSYQEFKGSSSKIYSILD